MLPKCIPHWSQPQYIAALALAKRIPPLLSAAVQNTADSLTCLTASSPVRTPCSNKGTMTCADNSLKAVVRHCSVKSEELLLTQ